MPETDRLAITYLFSRECPSHEEGLALLGAAAADAGLELAVTRVEVRDDAQAERLGFTGSPTYRDEDGDLLPDDGPAHAYRFDACRLYHRSGGRGGPLPDHDDLAAALRAAAARRTAA